MDFDNPKKAICCCCTLTSVVAIAVLGFLSFSSLDATEYGIDYSSITKTVDKNIYQPGYHFLGFGHKFIRFPSTVQSMEFSSERSSSRPPIQSRTEDGLMITFKATVQYQLKSESLFDLYMKYGESYENPCEKHVIEALNDAATRYDANSFFISSDTINNRMRDDLQVTLSAECYADVRFFQISGVDLPNKFEAAIQETQIQENEINTAMAEKNNIGIELKTEISNATNTMDVIINKAKAQAEADIQRNDANMDSLQQNIQNQAAAYATLKTNLVMTNEQLLKYIKSQTIAEYNQNSLVVTIPSRGGQ